MMKNRLTRSFTFRLTLTYMTLFGGSVVLLMLFIYWSTASYMAHQTDAVIEAEISGLADRYEITGLAGLVTLINERLSRQPTGLSIYLVVTEGHNRVLGNLDRWPEAIEDEEGWLNFRLSNSEGGKTTVHEARARRFALSGGFNLLVGRDISPLVQAKERIAITLGWGLGLTLVLGAVGGWWMSRRMAHRIETINRASREIMSGDLSRRMPLQGTDDELDRLADNLNRMLDRIQTLMEDVRRVSDNIAHDLRTPLSRLHNQLDTLRHEIQSSGLDTAGVEQALRESEALLATFNALLRIARIESAQGSNGFVPVDMANLAHDVADYYEPLAEARGQLLEIQQMQDTRLMGDRDLLFQALANLLDNAIKYTPEGGRIGITLQRVAQDEAELVVSDTGPGIPSEAHRQIFQRFFRLEDSRSTPGSGLGLSLVDAVARLHGIAIEVADNAPGARFVLRFASLPSEP